MAQRLRVDAVRRKTCAWLGMVTRRHDANEADV
jgi:hypothetical protein